MLLGFRSTCLALAGFACTGLALGGGGCIVAPPPDVPSLAPRPPRILHDSVVPPAGLPLPAWPSNTPPNNEQLIVPVVVEDPPFDYRVFVDFTQLPNPLSQPKPPQAVDGGAILSISINPEDLSHPINLGGCHQIKVVVAHSFLSDNTPDSLGGDSVSWPYYPSTGAPYTCTVAEADAGAALDGAGEALPIPPLSDGGDL